MAAPKGNKFGPGGARPGSGPKSKQVKANLAEAEEIAKRYIAKYVKPVLETYRTLAKGRRVKVLDKQGKFSHWAIVDYDATILKHYMDRILPARLPEDKTGSAVPWVIESPLTRDDLLDETPTEAPEPVEEPAKLH